MLVLGQRWVIARSVRQSCSEAKPSSAARAARCWSVLLRRRRAAVTWRGEGVTPAVSSGRGVCAGGGVIHALGVPGAPPLRETSAAEVTCSDERIVGGGEPTHMGNVDKQHVRQNPRRVGQQFRVVSIWNRRLPLLLVTSAGDAPPARS